VVEIRLENESRKLEERYWSTTNEKPDDPLARAEELLSQNKKSDNNHIRGIVILVDLIKDGTVNDRKNPANKGKEKIRLLPMNWSFLRTFALIMRDMK
jgi:hypothetical protein